MEFSHRFRVQAPLAMVAAFHRRSASMGAITPPPVIVRVHRAPAILQSEDEMAFTMWLGPLPVHWLARIERVTPTGFVDRQLKGPFQQWVHRHTFRAIDEETTEVIDELAITVAQAWPWNLIGGFMVRMLPLLFTYRAWRTKQLLENTAAQTAFERAST